MGAREGADATRCLGQAAPAGAVGIDLAGLRGVREPRPAGGPGVATLPGRAGAAGAAELVGAAVGSDDVGLIADSIGVPSTVGIGFTAAGAFRGGDLDTVRVPRAIAALWRLCADAGLDPLGAARTARGAVGGRRAEMAFGIHTEPVGVAERARRAVAAVSTAAVVAAHAGLARGDADVGAGAVPADLSVVAEAAEGAAAVLAAFPALAEGLVVAGLTLACLGVAEAIGTTGAAGEPALGVGPTLPAVAIRHAARAPDAEGLGLEVAAGQGDVRARGREEGTQRDHGRSESGHAHLRTSTGSQPRRSRRPRRPRRRPG